MSKKTKWFTSAFSQESEKGETKIKIPRKSQSFSNSLESISLLSDDEENLEKNSEHNHTFSLSENPGKQSLLKQLDFNWLEYFSPQCIDDLAVHTKKITEVQNWLQNCENIKHSGKILLISGPAGSGKTTTVKIIAKTMNYELVEWINPVGIETISLSDLKSSSDSIGIDKASQYESQIAIFKRFLFRSSRYKSLISNFNKRLILVEDFPNVFLKNPEELHNILNDYFIYGKSPLIFTMTDSKCRNLNIHNIFPDQIRNEYNITEILFNSVSTTMMKKALKRITNKLKQEYSKTKNNFEIPSDEAIDNINLTAQGDIRNAILNLQLICIRGVPELTKKLVENQNNKRKHKNKKFSSIGQDENLTLMHALGRIMYPKYNLDISPSKLIHSPEEIADKFSSEVRNFSNLIHANYLTHFKCIEDIEDTADNLSLVDIIMNDYKAEDFNNIGLSLAVRAVMVGNRNPSSGWIPIKGVHKQNQNGDLHLENDKYRIENNITKSNFSTDYTTYIEIIKKQ